MKKEFLDVYERPEAEELKVTVETNILSGQMEDPDCIENEVCLDGD